MCDRLSMQRVRCDVKHSGDAERDRISISTSKTPQCVEDCLERRNRTGPVRCGLYFAIHHCQRLATECGIIIVFHSIDDAFQPDQRQTRYGFEADNSLIRSVKVSTLILHQTSST